MFTDSDGSQVHTTLENTKEAALREKIKFLMKLEFNEECIATKLELPVEKVQEVINSLGVS